MLNKAAVQKFVVNRRWLVLLLLSVALGIALRSNQITYPFLLDGHAWRQADTASFTHGYLTETLNLFDPSLDRFPCEHRDMPFGRAETELPIVAWLAALPLAALGISYPPAPYLRIVAVLCYVGTSLFLFLLSRRLTKSEPLAVGSVFAFSVLPISIFFTRTPQPDGATLLFTCAFLYFLDRWMEHDRAMDGVWSWLFGTLTFLSKISAAYLLFPALFLIVETNGWVGSLKRISYWLWGICILIPVAAWSYWSHRLPWTFGIWSGKYTTWAVFTGTEIWRVLSERLAFDILSWAGIVLTIVGYAQSESSRTRRFCAVWFASILLFIGISLPANHTHVYYQLPLVLPASIMIALGISALWGAGLSGRSTLVAAGIVHSITTVSMLKGYFRQEPNHGQVITMIQKHTSSGEKIVSSDRDPRIFYNAKVKGLFLESANVERLQACMGNETRLLLLAPGTYGQIGREPRQKRALEQAFTQVDSAAGFTLWRQIR